jgi:hypothetical protein
VTNRFGEKQQSTAHEVILSFHRSGPAESIETNNTGFSALECSDDVSV